jgi:hypothetical protein
LAQPPPLVAPGRRPSLEALGLAADRPLLIVDVDEVLGLFVAGFSRFVEARGLELRLERFSLFQSLYRPGERDHVEAAEAQGHLQDFFRLGCGDMEPSPGAAEALRALSRRAGVAILSNAPPAARLARARWLGRHGLDYPLILGDGPKGPLAAALAQQTSGPAAFIDDLLTNLDSVAEAAPAVHRFQHVADPRLRTLAPSAPERHARIDDWPDLKDAIEAAIRP